MDPVFPGMLAEIDALLDGAPAGPVWSQDMLVMGEQVLEAWLAGRGEVPGDDTVEGFRLLALHRQGCKGVPSFNACRETCREIVFHHNAAALYRDDKSEMLNQLRLQAMVVKHLALFVGGKLIDSGLGDFCCASRPLHQPGAA